MILGIDASNIRSGGTVTHLSELLRAASPRSHGFEQVVVWSNSVVLRKIDDRPWLRKISDPLLEQSADPFRDRRHLLRFYWQRFRLARLAARERCTLLFVPGGLSTSGFAPMVAMSQNMLPFQWDAARGYGWSLSLLRIGLLRLGQTKTFRKAVGVLFLTKYARDRIVQSAGLSRQLTTVIPHGIGEQFFMPPRAARRIEECTPEQPFKLLYVSTIDAYKHQLQVIEATLALRRRGLPIALTLAGPANGGALKVMKALLRSVGAAADCVSYLGPVDYREQARLYKNADLGVFASSCENLPIILLEGMAAGLPIACSNREPMPEVLGDAGVYFDPERAEEIAGAIEQLIRSPELRTRNARLAFERASTYSWRRCADSTFQFLADCASAARADAS